MRLLKKMLAVLSVLVLLMPAFPVRTAEAASKNNLPYSAVAYMEIEYKCGCTRVGTGTMVSKYALLTAGHNLLCSKHNKAAKTIDFWFGYTSKSDYHYRYNGNFTFYYYCDFSGGYESKDDIGYVIFKKNVGQYTGWFGTRWYSNENSLDGKSIRSVGFKNGKMATTMSTLSVYNSKQVTFKRSVDLGAEGGAVYAKEGDVYRLLAVYTSFTETKCFARRLTESIFNDMKKNGANFN